MYRLFKKLRPEPHNDNRSELPGGVEEVISPLRASHAVMPKRQGADATLHLLLQVDGTPGRGEGLAGLGAVIRDERGRILMWRIGSAPARSNNEAEYQAMIFGLHLLSFHLASRQGHLPVSVRCVSDSQVVVEQLSGRASGKSPRLRALCLQAAQISRQIGNITFSHVPRHANRLADALAWEALGGTAELMECL